MDKRSEFELFYNEHLSAVARYATQRCKSADAVDITAETFAIAWRRFDVASHHPNPRAWLFGIARRVLSNHHRSTNRRLALSERLYSEWMAHASPAILSSLEPLNEALQQISDGDREVLLLAGVEELSPAEIALVLEISPGTARTRLSRARKRLVEALDRLEASTHREKEQA